MSIFEDIIQNIASLPPTKTREQDMPKSTKTIEWINMSGGPVGSLKSCSGWNNSSTWSHYLNRHAPLAQACNTCNTCKYEIKDDDAVNIVNWFLAMMTVAVFIGFGFHISFLLYPLKKITMTEMVCFQAVEQGRGGGRGRVQGAAGGQRRQGQGQWKHKYVLI